jgi:hypothetical protein
MGRGIWSQTPPLPFTAKKFTPVAVSTSAVSPSLPTPEKFTPLIVPGEFRASILCGRKFVAESFVGK